VGRASRAAHHNPENLVGIPTRLPENRELALVVGIMGNGPPEPPGAEHQPANTAEQTMEYWLASGMKHHANHRPLARAWKL